MSNEQISLDHVTATQIWAWYQNVNMAFDAMQELCRDSVGQPLYRVVCERIDAEAMAFHKKIAENINVLIDRLNEARARLAGADVNVNAVEGERSFSTGKGCPVEIHEIGISRIGKSDAWCLTLDNEVLDGTALKEADADRIMEAIFKWHDAKNAERRNDGAAPEKAE